MPLSRQPKDSDPRIETENTWKQEAMLLTKNHIRNRSLPIYPDNPVYVERVTNGLQSELNSWLEQKQAPCGFCLYYVMLQNLKYVNEVVVDISTNSVQSLFWLGAAHGAGVNAISIRHDLSQNEKATLLEAEKEQSMHLPALGQRNIFDISGLWTAVLHANDTERFYRQLAVAQLGIEQRTKLMLREIGYYNDKVTNVFWETNHTNEINYDGSSIEKIYQEKEEHEAEMLESYYRTHFWRPMLKRNRFQIYSRTIERQLNDGEPRSYVSTWDMDAISAFSYYLSKRKMIGEYEIKPVSAYLSSAHPSGESQVKYRKQRDEKLKNNNYICVGSEATPFTGKETVVSHLNAIFKPEPDLYHRVVPALAPSMPHCPEIKDQIHKRVVKGFLTNQTIGCNALLSQNARETCRHCTDHFSNQWRNSIIYQIDLDSEKDLLNNIEYVTADTDNIITDNSHCRIGAGGEHYQIAQLLLWRENPLEDNEAFNTETLLTNISSKELVEDYVFRASLAGASGPATKALATLFVDNSQKEKAFKANWDAEDYSTRFPLRDLQEKVRALLIEEFRMSLREKLGSDNQTECFLSLAEAYLSTVLYRYFFPYLSKEDEARICNGLQYYLRMMMGNLSVFNQPKEESKKEAIAREVLQNILNGLRALEVFYQVHVSLMGQVESNSMNSEVDERNDFRQIHTISLIKKSDTSDNQKAIFRNNSIESGSFYIRFVIKNRKR